MENSNSTTHDELVIDNETQFDIKMQRRSFLRYAGAGAAGIGMFAVACKKNSSGNVTYGTVDVGSGDVGILNYAYALEQLEAAFYTQVVLTPYPGISPAEITSLIEIRNHELLHRDLFRTTLGTNAIPMLSIDFSSINFNDRITVLNVAKTFEDTGVSAYNGIAYLIQNAAYLTLAGKIVSVEGRHAAFIRDTLNYGTFADTSIVDAATALDTSRLPSQVLPLIAPYLNTTVTATQLP